MKDEVVHLELSSKVLQPSRGFLRCAVVRRDQDQPAVRAVQVGHSAGGDRVHGGRNDDVCGAAGRRQPETLAVLVKLDFAALQTSLSMNID